MSDCEHPKIRAENRSEDMQALFGDRYEWFEQYLDGKTRLLPYSQEQKAFIAAYEGVMVGFLDTSVPAMRAANEDGRLRAVHFRDAVRDTIIEEKEMREMLTMNDYTGTPFAAHFKKMSPQMREDFPLLSRAMVNAIADLPEDENTQKDISHPTRYAQPETEGVYTESMATALSQVNAQRMAEIAFGGGVSGALQEMEMICGAPTPPPTPHCSKEERAII